MFSYASEICIEKAQSFQGSDFDADILRPQCRLSDPRQTIGLFVGSCPFPVVRRLHLERERPIAGPRQPNQSRGNPSLHGQGEFGTRPLIALTRAAYVIRPWASAGSRADSRILRSWTSPAANVA